jgi:hypothetical protein
MEAKGCQQLIFRDYAAVRFSPSYWKHEGKEQQNVIMRLAQQMGCHNPNYSLSL